MTRTNRKQAPRSAVGTCRDRRSPKRGDGRAWVRPFVRANRAISASVRLISKTLTRVRRSEKRAQRRPIGASRNIHAASAQLVDASRRLCRAARDLARTQECFARDPRCPEDAPQLLADTGQSLIWAAEWLDEVSSDVFNRHEHVLHGLRTGTLVPERPADRRPRIRLTPPRPARIRAFLQARQPRVIDRIAPILRRRRRTPRPAAVRVPRRSMLGRAPPFSSVCLL